MNVKKLAGSTPFLMGLLLCFWGSYATIGKFILAEIDNYQLNFYLFLFSLFVFPMINFRHMKNPEKMEAKEYGVILLSGIVYFAYYFTYAFALNFIPAVEASMINYLFPIMIVIFAVIIHKERLSLGKVAAIILGFLGVFIIATNGYIFSFRLSNPLGDLMAFTAAISWGLFSNLGRWLKRNNALCNYIFQWIAFILSAIAMFAVSDFVLPSWKTLLLILCVSTTNLSLGLSIWFKILKTVPTTLVACMTFITPFINLVFITVFLGEKITGPQILGALAIVLGILLQSGVLKRLRPSPVFWQQIRHLFRKK